LFSAEPRPADRLLDGADLHLCDLALRGLAPPGLGGGDRAHHGRAPLLAPRARGDATPGANAPRMIRGSVMDNETVMETGIRIQTAVRADAAPEADRQAITLRNVQF